MPLPALTGSKAREVEGKVTSQWTSLEGAGRQEGAGEKAPKGVALMTKRTGRKETLSPVVFQAGVSQAWASLGSPVVLTPQPAGSLMKTRETPLEQ